MLGSWDHEEWVEALRHVGGLSRWRWTSRFQRRSWSGWCQCSQMPVHDGHPWATSSNMPLRCRHGVTLLPCATTRCYCGTAMPHDVSTMPKVASAISVTPYAWSNHSSEGTARALPNQDETLEDDFQMLVCHVRCWGDSGHRSSARGRLECSRGSPGQQAGYHIDIGEEEEMLETVDPTWQTTCWLQLAVQGILDDEVPWYKYITPLMLGAEGMALSLAKRLLAFWQWSVRVQGWDICPPTQTVLNIGQFMTWDEVQGDMDNSLWFEAYSHALQRVWEAMCSQQWQWSKGRHGKLQFPH